MLPPFPELVERLMSLLGERERRRTEIDEFRRAAVALLLREHEGAAWIPMTRRSPDMSKHSNQISLPGGVCDPEDATPADTARREADEEIAIPPSKVEVLGLLDDVITPTGFVITPVVGVLHGDVAYRPNPREVAEVFEIPLDVFADPAAKRELGDREIAGRNYRVIAYRWNDREIWGATARMFEMLIDALCSARA